MKNERIKVRGEEKEEVISELISSDIAPPRLAHLVSQFNQHCRLDSSLDVSIISFDCFDFIATHYLYGPCLIALFSTHVLLFLFGLLANAKLVSVLKLCFLRPLMFCCALFSLLYFPFFYPVLLIK